jgi:hypothetical protein
MRVFFEQITKTIEAELESTSVDSCDISMEESYRLIEFFQEVLEKLRDKFTTCTFENKQEEIYFFKEMKPSILSKLLFFNKIYTIEIKLPNGSNVCRKTHYENELNSLAYFFNRNLDFYQYYRSSSTHLDECYFLRGKPNIRLCVDSSQFISDPVFSTGYDYKVAKILSNEMLRIYLNKKLQFLDKCTEISGCYKPSDKTINKWTGSKSALTELGYAIYAAGVVNNGNADIREIMAGLESLFGVELGDYYRTYIGSKKV